MFTTQDNNPDSHVPAEPVRAHVADLITAGLTPTLIAHLAGIDTRRVHVLLDDRTERGTVRTGEHRLTWRIAEA
ncbi:hypothetical protein, partial [Mycolicibacterium mageritense]|uniref:hypothetical protein n=1 Tax=Mycolicibacterium mageritense TaxID=53462 RepID=UPI001E6156E9